METQIRRRRFLQMNLTGLGTLAFMGPMTSLAAGLERTAKGQHWLDDHFPRYTAYDPDVPVWCITPDVDRCISRFHLSSPVSPSGRYVALTRLSREDRQPDPGELAEIVLVDLKQGGAKLVAGTRGWDSQMGAHAQWGATDEQLLFNDVDTKTWMPFGVVMNPLTGKKRKLEGTVYDVSPDGKWAVSTCLRRISNTQGGYGVIVPKEHMPSNKGVVTDDGVYVTNVRTGKTKMVASHKTIVETAVPRIDVTRYGPGDFYGFHTKWNSKSDRLFLVLRFWPSKEKKYKPHLITMKPDGTDIRMAIPATLWADRDGNHPNWCPDGEHVMMNLDLSGNGLQFVQARYDGTDRRIMTDVPANRGHPSLHPGGRFILTDAYPREDIAWHGDETAPLMIIDRKNKTRKRIVRMQAYTRLFEGSKKNPKYVRVDLHPAWDSKTHTLVVFNGVADGTRRVFIADLSGMVGR